MAERYRGTLKTGKAHSWKAQIRCRVLQKGDQRIKENLQIGGFSSEAQAAAGFDVLSLWRHHLSLGNPNQGLLLNFSEENYAPVRARLRACRGTEDIKQLMKDLLSGGELAALVPRDPPKPSAAAAPPRADSRSTARAPSSSGAKRSREQGGVERPKAEPPAQQAQGGGASAKASAGDDRRQTRPRTAGPSQTAEASAPSHQPEPRPEQKREAPPKGEKAAQSFGREVLGSRIKVFWPLERRWYSGTVTGYDAALRRHEVEYDDGDVQLLDLARERVQLQRGSTATGSGAAAQTGSQPLQSLPSRSYDALPGSARVAGDELEPAWSSGRPSFEEMYERVREVVAGVEGLEAGVLSTFMSSFVHLKEAWQVQYEQLSAWAQQGRRDLVREWVLRSEELY